MSPHVVRQTSLSANIIGLCRYLRTQGLKIGSVEQADALKAITVLPFRDPFELQLTLKTVLSKSRAEQERFDRAYQAYWDELFRAIDSKIRDSEELLEEASSATPPATRNTTSLQSLKDWLNTNKADDDEELGGYSPVEVYAKKDFSTFSDDDLHEVMKLLAVITKSMAIKFSRRYKPAHRHDDLDLRRTMRLSMRRGGDPIDLAFRRHKIQKLRLIVICDVSKSMDVYSRFLLQFVYSFQHVYRCIESFVFSTSLHRITAQLLHDDYRAALRQLAATIPDWSGGTKIGQSLNTFVEDYGTAMLDKKTIVLIMSDGWDTGDGELLSDAMREIHQKAGRVLWLNPLAGNENYEPTVRGMQAALPYIDTFAPLHNIESLKSLIGHLKAAQNSVNRRKRRGSWWANCSVTSGHRG